MTHPELVGSIHGPPSEEIGHHSRLQNLFSKGDQPGISTMFIASNRTRLDVKAFVCVDFENEIALDGRDRW